MERITEPELMNDALQAKTYAEADFDSAHSQVVTDFKMLFPKISINGEILDLGCGPGDFTFRFAKLFNTANITGIDGAPNMLKLARARSNKEALNTDRIHFIETTIPSNNIPQKPYELIISNSLLHHLHDPLVLWETILQHSSPETILFIADLCRPEDRKSAQRIVNEFAAGEPDLLRRDFYNSLLAAFSPAEIKDHLKECGLGHLSINQKGHHLFIYGKRA